MNVFEHQGGDLGEYMLDEKQLLLGDGLDGAWYLTSPSHTNERKMDS